MPALLSSRSARLSDLLRVERLTGSIRHLHQFSDVWLWWGRGWAVQFWPGLHFSLGFHLDFKRVLDPEHTEPENRPLLDLHLGWLIIAIGPDAHITGQRDRQKHSCRGFLFSDNPEL